MSVAHADSHDIRDGIVSSAVLVLVGHYKVQYTHDTTNDSHSSVVPECGVSWRLTATFVNSIIIFGEKVDDDIHYSVPDTK